MPEGKQELVAVRATPSNQTGIEVQQKQRRQMLIALGILVLAVLLLLLKDWHYWFAAAPASAPASEQLERSIVPIQTASSSNNTAAKIAQSTVAKSKAPAVHPAAEPPAIVATDRAVLPPLEVEVVAGSHHSPIKAGSNTVHVDLQSETADPQVVNSEASNSSQSSAPVVEASATMHLSPNAAQVVSRSVEPSYPMLAKQMKVQGSVVLQALIGRNGAIEDLHVLSGPAILSSAAMQAVKQWRFRPYYLSGEPVETQARITVNFTISTN
jgi:TonB family protein